MMVLPADQNGKKSFWRGGLRLVKENRVAMKKSSDCVNRGKLTFNSLTLGQRGRQRKNQQSCLIIRVLIGKDSLVNGHK